MNRDKIQRALADVHLAERSSTNKRGYPRAKAVSFAIDMHGLDDDEIAVLCSATRVDRWELKLRGRPTKPEGAP